MRFWLCLLLMCVFALQVLPVKRVGKAMAKYMTSSSADDQDSDLAADDDGPVKLKKNIDTDDFFIGASFLHVAVSFKERSTALLPHTHTSLLPHYSREIPTPPPDHRA